MWIEDWYNEESSKSNILVFSKPEFREISEYISGKENIAVISIESTPECARYWLEEEKEDYDNQHILESSERVLNIEFDDLTEDREYNGHLFRAIDIRQARIMVDFIDRNIGKHFIIHCKAGMSRSQAVGRFILDMYPDYYALSQYNRKNPCQTPNYEVFSKLKAAWREKWVDGCGPSTHPWFSFSRQSKRLVKCYQEHKNLVIGYDFDGTIYDTNKVGGDFGDVIDLLKKCTDFGFTMCLWTAEPDPEKLAWKIEYAKKLGIGVDYVNESPLMPGTKKPYFNILLDDRAGLPYTYILLFRTLEILTGDKDRI